MSRKIRMGMVGGGIGAFIGAVHRMAAGLDAQTELVCGAFSSAPEKSLASGAALSLPPERCYPDYVTMIVAESSLPAETRMDFVAIVTPNSTHFPIARFALQHGFHVMSDKPATFDLAEARELAALVEKSGLLYGLTHNYTGYPMIKQARWMVQQGILGDIRKIVAEYPQGWLSVPLEASGQKQADWRTDPSRAGASCCMGDIGTHAENLTEYVTGLEIEEVAADLTTFVPGRLLEDDGNVLVRFRGGARGVLYASQISIGEENGLRLRVYGTRAALDWTQLEPNTLTVRWPDRPAELYRTGHPYLCPAATAAARIPAGHPEGFIEAFANLYRNFATVLQHRLDDTIPPPEALDFPGIADAVRGMAFIQAVVQSSQKNAAWTSLETI